MCFRPEDTSLDRAKTGDFWAIYPPSRRVFSVTCDGESHQFLAHRVAYELANGPVGDTQPVRQTCENPLCCNPSHLVALKPRDSIWTLITEVNASFWADVEEFCLGLAASNRSKKTISTYKGILRELTQWLVATHPEVKSIVDLQRIHVRDFNRALQADTVDDMPRFTVRTRAKYLNAIRSMLRYFARETDLPVLSRDRISVPDVSRSLPRAYAMPEDVQRLYDCCDRTTEKARRDAAILAVLAASGLRVAELVSLERSALPVDHLGADAVLGFRVVGKGGDTRKWLELVLTC